MAMLLAFTPDQVCKVTSLTRRQLRYWDTTGFFKPQYIDERRRFSRMYSFRDVVGLRTVARLRDRLPLQELRRIGAWLSERYEEPWAELRFLVIGNQVVFDDGECGRRVAGTGQAALPIYMAELESETEAAAANLLERDPTQIGSVVRNRYVQHNAWVIDGTRIPTTAIWDFHLAGYGSAAIRREYPRLTPADITAAIDFEKSRNLKAR